MYDELVKRLKNCATQAAPCLTCDMTDDCSCIETLMKQAADAMEELSRDLNSAGQTIADLTIEKAVRGETRWIPVTERLPEDDIVCILTNGISDAIGYRGKVFGWHLIWTDYVVESEVTHWMPLPEPPKEE